MQPPAPVRTHRNDPDPGSGRADAARGRHRLSRVCRERCGGGAAARAVVDRERKRERIGCRLPARPGHDHPPRSGDRRRAPHPGSPEPRDRLPSAAKCRPAFVVRRASPHRAHQFRSARGYEASRSSISARHPPAVRAAVGRPRSSRGLGFLESNAQRRLESCAWANAVISIGAAGSPGSGDREPSPCRRCGSEEHDHDVVRPHDRIPHLLALGADGRTGHPFPRRASRTGGAALATDRSSASDARCCAERDAAIVFSRLRTVFVGAHGVGEPSRSREPPARGVDRRLIRTSWH